MSWDLSRLHGSSRGHVPDILDCFANLSTNEVPTSPGITNQILELLPAWVWQDSTLRWLDPATTSGVFLREVGRRLMSGLETEFPDEVARRNHILHNMLFGIAQTKLSAELSRRTLYYSRLANSDRYSVSVFPTKEGNIVFQRNQHTFNHGACDMCGAPESLERGDDRENYAYSFIHNKEVFDNMEFDVIIGNPPYQLEVPGTSDVPIYQHFVRQAKSLEPRYISFIIPSRWFAGGKGLDDFRSEMLADKNVRALVDYPNAADCFPGVEIKGGVCYFLRDRESTGTCTMTTVSGGVTSNPVERKLDEYDVFVRSASALPILGKVQAKGEKTLETIVSGQTPFGLHTNFTGYSAKAKKGSVKLYMNFGSKRAERWVPRASVEKNDDLIDKWKVLIPMAYGAGETIPHQILGQPLLSEPGSCCTQTYLVVGPVKDQAEAEHLEAYLRTRFVRFLVSLRKISQHAGRSTYSFVPAVDLTKSWTDADLYKRYGLTKKEIAYIESQVKAM